MTTIITIVLVKSKDKRGTTGKYVLISLFRVLNNLVYISAIYERIFRKKSLVGLFLK